MTIHVEESNSKITSSLRKIHLKLYRVAKTKFLESLYIARSLSKCIKRRSDGEISSVERGKRLKSQKKKKKGKQELVNLKFSIARRYYELKFDTHIGARWFEKRGGRGGWGVCENQFSFSR